MSRRSIYLATLLCACSLMGGLRPAWTAKLIAIKGNRNGEIGAGYLAYAGATLRLPDGSEVIAGPGAIIEIQPIGPLTREASQAVHLIEASAPLTLQLGDPPSPFKVVLRRGEIWEKLAPGSRFITETRSVDKGEDNGHQATIEGTPGTGLSLQLAGDGTAKLAVKQGEATLRNAKGETHVHAGQWSEARPGLPPTPAAPIAVNLPFVVQWSNKPFPVALLTTSKDEAEQRISVLPEGAARWQLIGDLRHDRNEVQKAGEAYERALAALPPDAPARDRAAVEARIGRILLESGKPADALEKLKGSRDPNTQTLWGLLSFSDAAFLLGDTKAAREAAEEAAKLDEQSAAAHLRLARARLQEGDIERPAREAAKAVRLDPASASARFLLGVARAQQGRLEEAIRELRRVGRQDLSTYLEAQAFLARIYLEQDRDQEAAELARSVTAQDPGFTQARQALGRAYWRGGQLEKAEREYLAALSQVEDPRSRSALYLWELAHVYLDGNRLPDALRYALAAVNAAPEASEAHAVLGLVYDRQGNRRQAELEYREAISLSPDNSLARLGLVTSFTPPSFGFFESGQERLREQAQALLRQPSVLRETFEPGKTSEIAGTLGADSLESQRYLHRGELSLGRVHDLSLASRFSQEGARRNNGNRGGTLQSDVAIQATPRTNVLLQYLQQTLNGGLPEAVNQRNLEAHARRRRIDYNLSLRQYLLKGTHLWLKFGTRAIRNVPRNGPHPVLRQYLCSPEASPQPDAILSADLGRDDRNSELRLDHTTGQHHLTYGLMALHQDLRGSTRFLEAHGEGYRDEEEGRTISDVLQYWQDDYRLGHRGTLIIGAQLLRTRDQGRTKLWHYSIDARRPALPDEDVEIGSENHHLLPYLAATYGLGERSLVRFLGYRTRVRLGGSLLAPSEAFIVGEPINIFFNGQLETYESDYEYRLSSDTFAKLFLQHSLGHKYNIQPTRDESIRPRFLIIPKVRERIVGAHVEHQINRYLSSFTRLLYVRADDRTDTAYQCDGTLLRSVANRSRGLQIPFSPRWRGLIGLNFTDGSGTKFSITGNLLSRQYTDVQPDGSNGHNQFGAENFAPSKRPSIGARALFDLRIAKEAREAEWEYGLSITNLFNTATLDWPHYPKRGRVWTFSAALRF